MQMHISFAIFFIRKIKSFVPFLDLDEGCPKIV